MANSSLSILPGQTNNSLPLSPIDGALKFDKLPSVVFSEILTYFTYEELAPLRQVNHFFQRNVSKRLNDAFMKLGRELGELSLTLKRRLPKKESQRKDHPLHKYSEIISAMETRYTLLSMTYKKYMDAQLASFPGKVLDLSFDVLYTIREYVRQDVYVQLNAITIMRDVRDYSTMASEHFDMYIVPLLHKRLRSLEYGRFISPLIRNTPSFISSVYSFPSMPHPNDFDPDYVPPTQASLNKITEQMDAQGKQVEDMRKIVKAQSDSIVQISEVLKEVAKFISPVQTSELSSMVHKMNASSASLQEMFNSPNSSSSSISPDKIPAHNRQLELIMKQNEHNSDWSRIAASSNKPLQSILKVASQRNLGYALRNRQTYFRDSSPLPKRRKQCKEPSNMKKLRKH